MKSIYTTTSPNIFVNSPNFKRDHYRKSLNDNESFNFSRQKTYEFPIENLSLNDYREIEGENDLPLTTCPQIIDSKKEIHLDLHEIREETENTHRSKMDKEINKDQNLIVQENSNKTNMKCFINQITPKVVYSKIFLTNSLDNNVWMKCEIERKLIDKKVLNFTMKDENGQIILSAVKRPKKSYRLYMHSDELIQNYLGKMKSNFFGTEFNAWDSGKNPKKEKNVELQRSNIATITYVIQVLI